MAITWGSWDGPATNRFRVGIDLSSSGRTLTAKYYVECTAAVQDNQTLTRTGNNISGAVNFYMSKGSSGGRHHVGTWSLSNRNYGQNYGFGAKLSGVYNGATPSVSTAYRMPVARPGAPGRPSVSNIESTRAYLSWSSAATNGGSIIEYQWQLARNSSFTTGESNGKRTVTNTQRSGLTRATTYYARVRARNSAGWGPWSSSRSFTTLAEVPSAPGRPSTSSVTTSSFYFSFSAPSNNGGASITSYQIQRSSSSSFSSTTTTSLGTSRSGTITGLRADSTYYIRARAKNSRGWGPWSSSRSVRTAAALPGAPGRPTLSDITSSSIRQTSTAAASNGSSIIEYQHQRSTSSSFSSGNLNYTSSSRTVNRTGLSRYTLYYFRARARNSAGWGPWSSSRSGRTLAEVPVVGTVPAASQITRNSARFSGWSAADNGGQSPNNLRIQYNTSQSATGASVHTQGSWTAPTITGLQANTTYYYRGAIANSAGWSSWSSWKQFTTLDDAPDDMEPPTFSAVGDTEMTISWTAPSMNGATFSNYRYEVSLDEDFAVVMRSGSTEDLSVTLAGLTPGTLYFVRVRANATPNNGGWGGASRRTTGIAPESGMRVYAFVGGVRRQGDLYTFVDGERRRLRPMYYDGQMRTE